MFSFSEVVLDKIIVHNIGSQPENEGVRLSKHELRINDETVESILKQYFLTGFKPEYFYAFHHETDLGLNPVYQIATDIFSNPESFYQNSVNLAQHLYQQSNHPKIKTGEFYVVTFKHVVVGDEIVDAIGLFKSETKDTFIKVYQKNDNFEVDYENGINIKKLDKGCLIFNTQAENGYLVSVVDSTNRFNEALYWRDSFLQIMPLETQFYQTHQIMDICRGFSNQVLTPENNVDRHEQVAFLKKAEKFFENNKTYDNDTFKADIIGNPNVIQAFEEFKQEFEQKHSLNPIEQFDLSENALKKGKKYFRSVIKLDRNFHIYVHSNPDYIEKGHDNTKGLKYYKLYFHDES